MKRIGVFAAILPAAGGALALGGCAGAVPAALISQHGEILRGTVTYTPSLIARDEAVRLTNGKTTCSGSFNGFVGEHQQSWTYPIACSDGRTGIATHTSGGGGKVRFSDGTEADLIFGEGAGRI